MSKQKGAFAAFIIRLAITATALCVAIMIATLAILSGFRYAVSEKVFAFMGHVRVQPFNETGTSSIGLDPPIAVDTNLLQSLRALSGVSAAYPYAVTPVILQAKGQLEGINLKGVDSNYRFGTGITSTGRMVNYADSQYAHDIVLSRSTANRLNLTTGDTVQINFIAGNTPRIRRLRVCGLYHSGMDDMDKLFAVCDLRLLQRLNNWGADSINGYQVDLADAAMADSVASLIHYNLIDPPLYAQTTASIYSFIFDWLQLLGSNSIILIIIMAIVAIIHLAAALLILIIDRAVMIGLLQALGMPFHKTRNIFLYIAAIIGGTGILAGNILALGLCYVQQRFGLVKLPEDSYFMQYVPVRIVWWQLAVTDAVTLIVCVLCMWLPTLYIRRVQPAKVLQFK